MSGARTYENDIRPSLVGGWDRETFAKASSDSTSDTVHVHVVEPIKVLDSATRMTGSTVRRLRYYTVESTFIPVLIRQGEDTCVGNSRKMDECPPSRCAAR